MYGYKMSVRRPDMSGLCSGSRRTGSKNID